jgi:hypothetical protein
MAELAGRISGFCAERGITVDQWGDTVGWDVQDALASPETILDQWNLDCLREVCEALGVHWPNYLPPPIGDGPGLQPSH